jgi:RNA-binding protein PNO1
MDQQADIARMRQSADRYLQEQDNTPQQDADGDSMEDGASGEVPAFAPVSHKPQSNPNEYRRIRCPPHRYTPLRNNWDKILPPLVEHLGLQVRFNTKTRSIEMKSNPGAANTLGGSIQKGADFVTAFMLGFEVQDAVALLRLDDLYIDTFQVTDVKLLKGDHLSRAIGRIAGQDGKTRFAIENATRTRIVVADQRVSILGSYANIRIARDAICGLVMGAPPGKVYNNMRGVAKRMNER